MSIPDNPQPPSNGQFLVYQADDGQLKIDVRLEGETAWLTQAHMAALFQTTVPNVNMHLRNIFAEGELQAGPVIQEFLITAADGKKYRTNHYNLDAIISVGYRVKSAVATRFRIWATQHLPQRGYVSKPRVARNELPWDVSQPDLQPQRGCVTPPTPCLNPCPPSTSTLCSPPRTAGYFSTIPLSARKCTPTSRALRNNSIARPSWRAESRTTFTCWPGTVAPSRRRIGSRNSNASPAFGSKRETSPCMISPGSLVTVSFLSVPRTWMPCANTWPDRRSIIGSPRFRRNFGHCCGNMEWNGMSNTCGIETHATWHGGLTQPRWGWGRFATMTQGSAGRATLGWKTESRWDSRPEVTA